MSGPSIDLYNNTGIGLIVEHPTGVTFSNQAGGYSCLHPTIEGVFVPWENDNFAHQNLLSAYFKKPKHSGHGAVSGLDEKDADFIDSVIVKAKAGHWVVVNRGRLGQSMEAWVHVHILRDVDDADRASILSGFDPYPRPGILVWENSD